MDNRNVLLKNKKIRASEKLVLFLLKEENFNVKKIKKNK